ncbi:hypothetical protein TRIUR3_35068 [Triticum urartu]|uniref:Solute carrier family 35 member F1 n=1 Tax=Triticum urartu TaxID=4572 RepID=M7ZY38_TRIUA|nr:hypothetical protein TRIUR3_35068 [Triticum urartu]
MAPPPEEERGGGGCCARWLRREVLLALALGQLISLLITSTGFSSSELARRGINAPTSQSLLNYILLALVYGGILLYRRQPLTDTSLVYLIPIVWTLDLWSQPLSLYTKWYYYLILGIIDVEANYIVVKSYQYTSLTSVMLLDCWSIPCVIVLTWIFLKTKYGFRKFFGVGVCVAGLILVVFSDVHASDRAKGPKPLKGDLLVIVGSMLYACSNVTEEYLVKKNNRIELMAMLGIFGAVISGIQISILEREELHSIKWNAGAVFPFIGFALAMFLFYSTVPTVLKICGATMLNLSLLTSDMWAVLIRIFAYHEKVDWMYFVAFACTAGGLLVYSYRSSKEADDTAQVTGASDEQSRVGDEESGIQNQVRSSFAGGNDNQASYKELPSNGSPSKN